MLLANLHTVSFFTFLVAGFTKSALISLAFGIVTLFLFLMFFRHRHQPAG